MPPFGFRKRERSSSPLPTSRTPASKRSKPTLFETADAPSEKQKSLEDNKKYLEDLDGDDDDSSLSDAESEDFEDVPPAKRFKAAASKADEEDENEDEDEDEDEEVEWEDAIPPGSSSKSNPDPEITDISISMNDDGTYIEPLVSAATGKKGPSKRERQVRVLTHCLHVQTLMWHNTIRNSWLNDPEVQKLLLDRLTDGVKREVQRWKDSMDMFNGVHSEPKTKSDSKGKGKQARKGKRKATGRDWSEAAETSELDVRSGDALLRLLKVLTAYWRKRFTVTAPGLRKQGYKPLRRLRDEIRAWEKDRKDFEEYGERVESIESFRKLAKKCEGSRDVGAQLFVALLRGLGLETRMVANLQPVGFGWSKAEEADPKKAKKKQEKVVEIDSDSEEERPVKAGASKRKSVPKKTKGRLKEEKPSRKSARGNKADPISLDDSDSPLSSAPSEPDGAEVQNDDEDDDISLIDITPSTRKEKPSKKYDRNMAFPNYWTEVCSPVSHKYYPVDPIVLSTIASNDELLQTFEPRGKKAEQAKQVMAYTIAFSSDGTAKDVTVRYLKRHQLPGKTKGMRMSVEKVPIYNRKGKVKRYEEYDWFRTVMSVYDRPESKRTAADDLEEQTDLKANKPAKEQKQVTKESLQGYKQSADFVLEQHLRREEAILPGAEPVKYFTSGKGDKAQELPVYSRDDIATCKTVESWHKEGRAVKVGEQPLKYVPVRAVTLVRKREMEDVQRETGEKMKQGLYSEAQTDWIIPPPIQNGVIPKNAFGNMDVYVQTMVPKGAIHLPLKGSAKLCRKLGIDYAEACTGFEFGKQRAVPVLTGVVVAEENAGMVKDAWRAEQREIKRKEDTKRMATSLHWWRKMLLGLRVLERMRTEYAESGGAEEDMNPFIRRPKANGSDGKSGQAGVKADHEKAGGFLQPGYDEEEMSTRDDEDEVTHRIEDGGFVVEDENDIGATGGGFLIDESSDVEDQPSKKSHAPITPVSLQSMHKTMDGAADSDDEVVDTSDNSYHKARSSTNTQKQHRVKSIAASVHKPNRGRKGSISNGEEDGSPLSDLSESQTSDSKGGEDLEDSDDVPTPLATKKKAAPPKVVISNIERSRGRPAKKSTPVRSQYFKHSDDSEDVVSEEESDLEVVKPRKTTARTKARA